MKNLVGLLSLMGLIAVVGVLCLLSNFEVQPGFPRFAIALPVTILAVICGMGVAPLAAPADVPSDIRRR